MGAQQKSVFWRYSDGVWPNSIAFSYAFIGHLLGLYMLVQSSPWVWGLGVLLSAHSLLIAAYLIHECAHNTIFRDKTLNHRVGETLLWWVGAAYASFKEVQHMHMRHHLDRADVGCFDYQAFLSRRPAWLRRFVMALEWAYVPVIEVLMHLQVMVNPFINRRRKSQRLRVVLVFCSRLLILVGLYSLSPWALLGYVLAYLLFMQALFLADAFAHTYESYFIEDMHQAVPKEGRDRQYDVEHSFSNLLSCRWPWMNLWNLNFGYHTAHHARMSAPWHRLPKLHNEFYGQEHSSLLPYRELLKTLHRNRVRRVFVENYGEVGQGPGRADQFIGAHGVSFLTTV